MRTSPHVVVAMIAWAAAGQAVLAASDTPSQLVQPATPAPGSAEKLPEVTVTAQRVELEKRISKFVNQIAATENGAEGLARWGAPPACPLVSGLSEKDGEFILERVSEIGRSAGVPLGDEHCRANLYVLVTGQPEELLRGMEKRNRAYTFGVDASFYPPTQMPASVVDQFISTSRPVRVWYTADEKDAGGKPLAYCQSQMVLPVCDEVHHTAACDPNRLYRCSTATAGGSHLVLSTMWTFARVFVIVDQTRLKGVTLRQLADYVAMSGFAKLKADPHLADGTTILTLFDAAPEAAPAALTDWDQSFLKSLYATEQRLKSQRSQIAHQMAHEIVPDAH
jgi:hypothetical protein